jgi:hypothetical protein
MASPNVLGAYELLRRAMQQNFPQQGTNSSSTPNGAPGYDPDGYDSTQGGLLGRLLALQAEQSLYQPSAGNARFAPAVSADPNFRQLSRTPVAGRTQSSTNALTRSADQPSPTSSIAADPAFESPSTATQGAGFFSAYGNAPVAVGIAGLPMMTPAPVGLRLGGIPLPGPIPFPMAPGAQPRIPMPEIPEAWKTVGTVAKLLPWALSRLRDGGGGVGADAAFGVESPARSNLPPVSQSAVAALSQLFGHQMATRKDDDDDPTRPEPGSDEWKQNLSEQRKAEARARNEAGRKAVAASGADPGNSCVTRHEEEEKRCYKRSDEYPHWDFLQACKDRARNRRNMCSKNGGKPHPEEPAEWGPDDEEVFRNLRR